MASGKMSARQKMINLMYLVFIAMLAMNMSKEVLSAFGFMNEKLTENNISTTEKNNEAYQNLETKAQEQATKLQFEPLKLKADSIRNYSSDFYSYLSQLKDSLTVDVENMKDYESMDKTNTLDEYFFKGEGYTERGKEFLNKINTYKERMVQILGDKSPFVPIVENRFSTDSVINSKTLIKQEWLKARYEGYPLIASLTNFTQIQADIKNTESDIVSALLKGKMEESLSLNKYKGIVALNKTAYFSGERVKGQVVLGRYDATLVPDKVVLNGSDVTNKVKDGQVIIDMPAGNVGNKKIKGVISFTQNGKQIPVEFESAYSVISQPSEAVVSADKMNVVYRGLQNPISISMPGVGDKDIVANAPGLTKTGKGKYMITPSSGNEVTINVSGKLSSGKIVKTTKTFRIKDIPSAMGTVRNQFGTVRMPKSGLQNSPIGAGLPDFLFDLKLQVTGFKIKVPGQLTIVVNGSRLNAASKQKLNKAKRGDIINIYDIKAKVTNYPSAKIGKVLPVNIELTN